MPDELTITATSYRYPYWDQAYAVETKVRILAIFAAGTAKAFMRVTYGEHWQSYHDISSDSAAISEPTEVGEYLFYCHDYIKVSPGVSPTPPHRGRSFQFALCFLTGPDGKDQTWANNDGKNYTITYPDELLPRPGRFYRPGGTGWLAAPKIRLLAN